MGKAFLLACLVVSPCAAAEPDLTLYGSVNCDKGFPRTTAAIEANTLYIELDPAVRSGYPWFVEDLPLLAGKINQLLRAYGFDSVAAKFVERAPTLPESGGAVALNYRRNSFIMRVGFPSSIGLTERCTVCPPSNRPAAKEKYGALCPSDNSVYGHTYGSCYEFMAVNFEKIAHDAQPKPRRYAYMAAVMVHEFVHAVHGRMLAEAASGSLERPGGCPKTLTMAAARARMSVARKALGVSAESMHQDAGLLAPGGVLQGDANMDTGFVADGAKTLQRCLFDPKLPESALADLSGVRSSAATCLGGTAMSRFFALPAGTRGLTASFLRTRSAGKCVPACFYGMPDAPMF